MQRISRDSAKVILALKNEQRLTLVIWGEIFDEIIRHESLAIGRIYTAFRATYQERYLRHPNNSHQLQGGITKAKPNVVCTVEPFNRFRATNYERMAMGGVSKRRREREEQNLYRKRSDMRSYEDMILKRPHRLVWFSWVNWNSQDEPEDMFRYLKNCESIRNKLGLTGRDWRSGNKIIGFTFSCQKLKKGGVSLHKPSWCDGDFNSQFFPNSASSEFGQTITLIKGTKGVPEFVSSSNKIKFNYLVKIPVVFN
ncbi:MAG: hypothetical protein AAF849_04840 [Bacteroidota bacterium]